MYIVTNSNMQMLRTFYLSYRDQFERNQLYSDIQADFICANLLIYHLEIILINSSGGRN